MPTGVGAARDWVQSLGPGWYVPSVDEVNLVWQNRFHVNNPSIPELTLILDGGGYNYRTSNECSSLPNYSFTLNVLGDVYVDHKSQIWRVRGVRRF